MELTVVVSVELALCLFVINFGLFCGASCWLLVRFLVRIIGVLCEFMVLVVICCVVACVC